MPAMWASVGLGALNLGMGLMSSNDAEEELERLRKTMEKRLDFAKERFNHYVDTYGAVEQQMVTDAMQGVNADLDQVTRQARADVAGSYDRQEDEQERELQSYGLDPSSGRFQSSDRQMSMEQAADEAMAVNTARREESTRAENETRRMRESIGKFGAGLMMEGANSVQQAQQGVAQVHGQKADMYADMANNMFSNASSLAGYSMGQMGGGGGSAGGGTAMATDMNGAMDTTRNFLDDEVNQATNSFSGSPMGGMSDRGFEFSPDEGLRMDNYANNLA